MTLYRFLTPQEDLVAMRAKLALTLQRPVYISACRQHTGTHHKLPGETEYRRLGPLEVFLLPWEWRHVRREDRGGLGKDYFYSEAEDPFWLRLVTPMMSDEKAEDAKPFFSTVGLAASWNLERVYPSENEVVPPELVPYVFPYKRRVSNGFALRPGIRFAVSEVIAKPDHKRQDWHNGPTLRREHDGPLTVIQAPGQYPSKPVQSLEQINRFVQFEADPGSCVICHGRTGERRHIATFNMGEHPYPMGDMCKVCAKGAFAQILGLLDQPLPA